PRTGHPEQDVMRYRPQIAVSLHACVDGGATGLLRGVICCLGAEPRPPAGEPGISWEEGLVLSAWPVVSARGRVGTDGPFCDAGPCRCCRASGSNASLRVRPFR